MDHFIFQLTSTIVSWIDQVLAFVAARPTESMYVAIAAGVVAAFQLARRKAM